MAEWNHDMAKAPRGRIRLMPTGKGNSTRKVFEPAKIVVASACGVVTVSRWIDDERRWEMFTSEVGPIAWMPHPGAREHVDAKGRTRVVVDLPKHPTMAESWFDRALKARAA
ncbi:hypothetical protein [Pelagibacterium lentulum]|uniref:Uncharacterized protein n=1 Tax=Pelagibacterium lentulum TaxID=2029865 RepID=A0A916RPS0_9HYPH|nr:hypothetical protein [Pelagibacterium lentulum]GGA64733.1 hypothetical protein GCM10011499_39000 [Pelagibacterium lentulum]